MTLDEIAEIEDRYCRNDSPEVSRAALGEAFAYLNDRWQSGERDSETGIRLLFLAWYSCSEPSWLTGLPDDGMKMYEELFNHLNPVMGSNAEWLFVTGYMASLWPWCCGIENEDKWSKIGREHLKQFKQLGAAVNGEIFKGRGYYGHYFKNIVDSTWIENHLEATIEYAERFGPSS
jgi:hypothetical protein